MDTIFLADSIRVDISLLSAWTELPGRSALIPAYPSAVSKMSTPYGQRNDLNRWWVLCYPTVIVGSYPMNSELLSGL